MALGFALALLAFTLLCRFIFGFVAQEIRERNSPVSRILRGRYTCLD